MIMKEDNEMKMKAGVLGTWVKKLQTQVLEPQVPIITVQK